MTKVIKFPENIFSEKEVRDFNKRREVVRLLGVGETWKNIRAKTGAHLQTIAILTKRLKSRKSSALDKNQVPKKTIFEFGVNSENNLP